MIPYGYVKIAIENGHLQWVFPLKMVIFHSYVSLPEGRTEWMGDTRPGKLTLFANSKDPPSLIVNQLQIGGFQ